MEISHILGRNIRLIMKSIRHVNEKKFEKEIESKKLILKMVWRMEHFMQPTFHKKKRTNARNYFILSHFV